MQRMEECFKRPLTYIPHLPAINWREELCNVEHLHPLKISIRIVTIWGNYASDFGISENAHSTGQRDANFLQPCSLPNQPSTPTIMHAYMTMNKNIIIDRYAWIC
jgi:hypothetical protein